MWRARHVLKAPATARNRGYRRTARPSGDLTIHLRRSRPSLAVPDESGEGDVIDRVHGLYVNVVEVAFGWKLKLAVALSFSELGDPFGSGRELDALPCQTRPDAQRGGGVLHSPTARSRNSRRTNPPVA
jgi:hypothetical protein